MLTFYRNAAIVFTALLVLTALLVYGGIAKSKVTMSLYPARSEELPWTPNIEPSQEEGRTQLTVMSDTGTIDYEFFLDQDTPYPYTHYSFNFIKPEQTYRMVDLTGYHSISFRILCDPNNVMAFALFSFDDRVTNPLEPATRRVSSTAFSCSKRWSTMTIDFDDLKTPYWWLDRYGFELSDRKYQLNQIMGFAITNSSQSPVERLSRARLTDVNLLGRRPKYVYAAVSVSAVLWLIFVVWTIRRYVLALTARLQEQIRLDRLLIAYKKLSIEPQEDKDKGALLRYMATEYANSELGLESAAAQLGINRNKINEILKEELGLTFTAYLKKLRLTEAARLLSENKSVNISQIAYLVGYNSVSYFNKLFKAEYGCTPRTLQKLYHSREQG